MNKIFKVIWNNAKHCYIVASELAKSYSKGGGSRTMRRAAAALCIASVVYTCAGIAFANSGGTDDNNGNYIGNDSSNPPYTILIDSGFDGKVYGHKDDGNQNISEASVTVTGGTVTQNLYGGYSESGNVASNSVVISGGDMLSKVYGGYSDSSGVVSNSVILNGGKVYYNVYGGYSESGDVSSNSVIINDGVISYNVYGGVASGTGYATYNNVSINGGTIESVYGGYTEALIKNTDVCSNSVDISGNNILIEKDVRGGFTVYGNAISNSVNISGDLISIGGNIYGGVASTTGDANYNRVNISTGTLNLVYGGYSVRGGVASNSVTISGDATNIDRVYGGYQRVGSDNVTNNIVNISGGKIQKVYGGYNENTVGNGNAASNKVNITGGTIDKHVFGGVSENGNAASNSVYISGDTTNILGNIYGGVASSTGYANYNQVNIATGTLKDVYGGWSEAGNAASNSVTINGNDTEIDQVYGGIASDTGSTSYNKVNISDAIVKHEVYGGSSISGYSNNNNVTISGGRSYNVSGGYSKFGSAVSNSVNINGDSTKIGGVVYGGHVFSGMGSASYNIVNVNISDGTMNYVYGGYSDKGDAASNSVTINCDSTKFYDSVFGGYTDSGNAASNSVSISGDSTQIEAVVYGGRSHTGNAASNSVNISGGKTYAFYGGYAEGSGDANENQITMTAGEIVFDNSIVYSGKLFGGYSKNGNAASNSVNISGGTFDSNSKIYSGFVNNSNNSQIKDNSVNLSGTVTGLDNTEIYGYYYDNSGSGSHSGNVLHIGRAVDYDENCNIKRDSEGKIIYKTDDTSIWQGKTSVDTVNNLVKKAANFETLALHSVAWNTSLPALKATTMENVDTLDITDLKLYGTFAINDSMNLLEWENDGGGITNLKYIPNSTDDSQTAAFADNASGIAVQTASVTDTDKGIVLERSNKGNVKKANKTVQFSVTGFTLNSVDLSKWNGEASTVAATWNGATGGVSVVTGSFNQPTGITAGDNITILTTADSSFYDKNISGANKYGSNLESSSSTKDFTNDAEKGVTFAGKYAKGVKASDNNLSMLYAVGSTKYVTDITLGTIDTNEIRNMNGADYDFSKVAKIDASNLKIDNPEDLIKSATVNLLSNASNLAADKPITGSSHSQDLEITDNDSGIKFEGLLSGNVSTSAGAIQYTVNNKFINKIDLAGWNGKKSAEVSDKWDANAVRVAGNFADPGLSAGESKNILSASSAIFKDENIDESIRYEDGSFDNDSQNGVTLSGYKTGGVKATDKGKALTYYAMTKEVSDITLGSMKWGEGRTIDSDSIYNFKNVTKIDASELKFTNPEIMSGTMYIVDSAKNLDAGITVTGSSHSQKFDSLLENKAVVSATLTGEVSVESEKVKYSLDGITINKFDLANWDGEKASSVNTSWKLAEGSTVETDGMSKLPDSNSEKQVLILKSDTDGYFAKVAVKGENALAQKQFTDSDEDERVVLAGTQSLGVTLDSTSTNIVYKVGSKDITSFKLNTIAWKDGAELLSRDKYNYSNLTSIDTKDFNITYEKPETVSANQSMTLLKANDTLADMAAIDNSVSYQYEPVSGVTMDAIIRNSLEAKSGKVTLTAVSNNADKLTFGNVEWLDKGALIDHKTMLNNVSFDGATVDTTKIAFKNKQKLDADMQMTLVSDFDGTPGTITGSKYKVGTAYEGEGSAYMDGSDLMFKTKTGAGLSDETHTTVMAMEAGVAMLAAGNEHVGNAIEGLSLATNAGADGVSTFASVGGASSRYETGSHVDTNSWNCTLAVGKNLEKKDGTMEYGLFAEYGRGNYTLHMNGIEDAGSGNTHYTGGGLLLKFTNKHDVYTEASFRLGNMKDNASSLLHDGAGNAYGYDIKAKYRGGHIGFGKVYNEEDGTKLEIYSKYFYNQREGINFVAGADLYKLDDVRSRVLRAGFRLSSTDKKWNRYGGLAYDYEFGGQSNGTVNGNAIRSASVKGGTLRGEFGYCREATKTNPWKTDISLYGFTGQRRGFGGSVAVEYRF